MAKDAKLPADELVELLGKCQQADLDALDAKVAAKQAELDTLRAVRGFLAKKLAPAEPGPAPEPKEHWRTRQKRQKAEAAASPAAPSTQPAAPALGTADNARIRKVAIARLLAGRGPTPIPVIARETNIPLGSIHGYLKCDWFGLDEKTGSYRLTEFGRRQAGLNPGLPPAGE